MQTVSVIIPTLNASKYLLQQLSALHAQTANIVEVVLVDSQSEDDTCVIASSDSLCRIIPIQRADFDHGATRDLAARTCNSDYLWFLTQDAIPADKHCLAELLKAIQDDEIASAYARQITGKDASRIEQLNRLINYPAQGKVRSAKDMPELQIRSFFMSNTCCLYKREIYESCGGFQHYLPTNEDMLMASTFLHKGYRIAYCADAHVYHSHHMTLSQWYKRSFDIGAFMELFGRQLNGIEALSAGKEYALTISKKLLSEGRLFSTLYFFLILASRFFGDRAGHKFTRYSERSILRKTQNPSFWLRYLHDHSADYTLDVNLP